VAEEKGKVATCRVFYITTSHILKVPDVEGRANTLLEAKEISPLKIEGLPYFTKSTLHPGYVISTSNPQRQMGLLSDDL